MLLYSAVAPASHDIERDVCASTVERWRSRVAKFGCIPDNPRGIRNVLRWVLWYEGTVCATVMIASESKESGD